MARKRTTLNLDEAKLAAAAEATGVTEKTLLIHLGLDALVRSKAIRTLIEMGGTMPDAQVPPRGRGGDDLDLDAEPIYFGPPPGGRRRKRRRSS